VVPGDGTEVWGKIHMNRGRVGEERRGKEMDGCPLTEALGMGLAEVKRGWFLTLSNMATVLESCEVIERG
jgi:hypothetical protein